MIEYKLEDFKTWIEADPQRKQRAGNQYENWLANLQDRAKWEVFLTGQNYYQGAQFAGQGILTLGQEWKIIAPLHQEIAELKRELAQGETNRATSESYQAEVERQKREIIETKDRKIAQWKGKYHSLITQRKTTIQQEITLLKEILAHEQ